MDTPDSVRTNRLRRLLVPAALALALVVSGCGSDDDTTDDTAATSTETAAEETTQTDGATSDDGASSEPTETDGDTSGDGDAAPAPPGVPADGRYRVGDTYTDGEFDAVYLGLAQIPVGPDIFTGGACYAPLFEATYLDPLDFGSDRFQPATDAYLTDGRTAETDQTGVGCDQSVLPPAGYERGIETTIEAGATVAIYGSPFHVADADAGALDIISLFGASPETGLDPEVTLDLTS